MAEHGIGFAKLFDAAGYDLDLDTRLPGELFLLRALVGNKLVQGRVDQADGYRVAVHGLENSDEVAALVRKQLLEGADASFTAIGDDHLLDGELPVDAVLGLLEVFEDHVLGAAEADALRA